MSDNGSRGVITVKGVDPGGNMTKRDNGEFVKPDEKSGDYGHKSKAAAAH